MSVTIQAHLPGACALYPSGRPELIGDPVMKAVAVKAAKEAQVQAQRELDRRLNRYESKGFNHEMQQAMSALRLDPTPPRNLPPPAPLYGSLIQQPPGRYLPGTNLDIKEGHASMDVKGYPPPMGVPPRNEQPPTVSFLNQTTVVPIPARPPPTPTPSPVQQQQTPPSDFVMVGS